MTMHSAMAATLDKVLEDIQAIRQNARAQEGNTTRPLWPMIVLATPKGWTGPKLVDGHRVEGTFRSHQVPLSDPAVNPQHLLQLEEAFLICTDEKNCNLILSAGAMCG